MNAVFVDDDFNEIKTVSTSEVFDQMQQLDQISALVVDGVITQRLLQLADKKRVKLIAGAVLGDIEEKPKSTKYITFNRI
jgi:DNA primase